MMKISWDFFLFYFPENKNSLAFCDFFAYLDFSLMHFVPCKHKASGSKVKTRYLMKQSVLQYR